jgi:hypothetical protein
MPGKFEGNADQAMAQYLYQLSMNNWQDEDKGESDYSGWHSLFIFYGKPQPPIITVDDAVMVPAHPLKQAYVCTEDANGFFTCIAFETVNGARKYYDDLPDWGENHPDEFVLNEGGAIPRCDLCGYPQWVIGEDWNGETGNHHSCERKAKQNG